MRSPIAPRTVSGLKPAAAKLLTVSLLALALAGCKTLDDEPGAHVAGWTIVDPTQRHPIMVSQQPSTLTVRVARGSQGLTPAQKGQVAGLPRALPLVRRRQQQAGDRRAERLAQRSRCHARRRRHTPADHGLRLLRERTWRSSPTTTAATPARRSACPTCATSPKAPSADAGRPIWPTTRATCPIRTSAARSSAISRPRSPIPPTCSGPARWTPADAGAPLGGVRQVSPGQVDGRREEPGRTHPGRRPPTSRGMR